MNKKDLCNMTLKEIILLRENIKKKAIDILKNSTVNDRIHARNSYMETESEAGDNSDK